MKINNEKISKNSEITSGCLPRNTKFYVISLTIPSYIICLSLMRTTMYLFSF
jgi:hypothetical protein